MISFSPKDIAESTPAYSEARIDGWLEVFREECLRQCHLSKLNGESKVEVSWAGPSSITDVEKREVCKHLTNNGFKIKFKEHWWSDMDDYIPSRIEVEIEL